MRHYIYLDQNFKPFGSHNEIPCLVKTWAGGEEHPEAFYSLTEDGKKKFDNGLYHYVKQHKSKIIIVHRVNTSSDWMKVVQLVDCLRRLYLKKIHLFMPYMPYARQDRVMKIGDPHGLSAFCSQLNSLKLKSVTILDPHSDVTTSLVKNIRVVKNYTFLTEAMQRSGLLQDSIFDPEMVIISPDAGAYKKIDKTCEAINYTQDLIAANKVRDLSTGKIKHISIDGDVSGKICVIIDDIVDGGRTFDELAIILKTRGAKKVIVFSTFGIFSYGTAQLANVDEFWTTDAFRVFVDSKVHFVDLKDIDLTPAEF